MTVAAASNTPVNLPSPSDPRDIGQAQQTLASLQQQSKGTHHHGGHHHGGDGKTQSAPSLPNPSAATPSTSTSLDVTA